MQRPIRLMTLAPGHFHAALVQKEAVPGIHPRGYVYAPLSPDLLSHLGHIDGFNRRPENPTRWALDVRTGADWRERAFREQPGNVAVIAGRNASKIDLIHDAVAAGLHVLADKPWVIRPDDLPKLAEVFLEAELRELVVWDMMTERHDPVLAVARELIRDPDVFGGFVAGTPDDPALTLDSTHALLKQVAGKPLVRPSWWFDWTEAGDALADIGTHLADLALWLVCPDQPLDPVRDVQIVDASGWPTLLDRGQFAAVTGLPDLPADLPAGTVMGDQLLYAGNGTATATIRGIHIRFAVLWEYELPDGDGHEIQARGTLSRVTVRTAAGPERVRTGVTITPSHGAGRGVPAAVARRCHAVQSWLPGVSVEESGGELRVTVPDVLQLGHEAHFAAVVREFADYFHDPRRMPVLERSHLAAKYRLTTEAAALARAKQGGGGVGISVAPISLRPERELGL